MRVCRAFQKFEIFLLDAVLRVAKRKIFYWSTSKFIFSEINRKILRTQHTLEAYKVLIIDNSTVWLVLKQGMGNRATGNGKRISKIGIFKRGNY